MKFYRILSIVLCMVLVLGCAPMVMAQNVIDIDSKEDFWNIRNDLTAHYRLTADIAFTAADFAPGGAYYNDGKGFLPMAVTSQTAFSGTLDGNGCTVSGLVMQGSCTKVDDPTTPSVDEGEPTDLALFGYVSGTIKGLYLRDVKVDFTITLSDDVEAITWSYVSPLAGNLLSGSSVENCAVSGMVSAEADGFVRLYVGGIAAMNKGSVQNCAVYGQLSAEHSDDKYTVCGGIAGQNESTQLNTAVISNCYCDAEIAVTENTESYGGTLVGYNGGTLSESYYPENCTGVGINRSEENVDTPQFVPGIITDCSAVATAQKATETAYPGLNFTTHWVIDGLMNCPLPKLFECEHVTAETVTPDTPPTCVEDGVGHKKCTLCGTVMVPGILIPATGEHTPSGLITDKAPTCAEEGAGHIECTVCHIVLQSGIIGTTGNHTPGPWQVIEEATYAKEGLKKQYCTICGELLATQKIAKLKGENVLTVFKDITAGDWFVRSGAIDFAYNMKLFNGTSTTEFSPKENMTRGMFVTVLGRLHGVSSKKTQTRFTDVKKSDYFSGYVAWAAENKIVNGTSATAFSPNDNVTREQICTMMLRYCDYAKITLAKKNQAITFIDAKEISSYAKKAVAACQMGGVVNGENVNGGTRFRPQGNASRAEVATIMMNFYNNYLK